MAGSAQIGIVGTGFSFANPTLTIVALAARLGDHIKEVGLKSRFV